MGDMSEVRRLRMLRQLDALAKVLNSPDLHVTPDADLPDPLGGKNVQDADRRLGWARLLLATRRMRSEFFDSDLFGEPAWDLLLDLYTCHARGQPVSISSACIAANVPQTTALRWVKELTARGILDRTDDPRDHRRSYVSLSEASLRAVEAFLDTCAKHGAH